MKLIVIVIAIDIVIVRDAVPLRALAVVCEHCAWLLFTWLGELHAVISAGMDHECRARGVPITDRDTSALLSRCRMSCG